MKISCIGTGAMGGAIIRSICKKFDSKQVFVTDVNSKLAETFANENNCNFVKTNKEVIADADFIFLAVKPQFVKEVLEDLKFSEKSIIISMAAGVKIEKLQEYSPNSRFVRIMPNVCAQIGEAMIAVSFTDKINLEEKKTAISLLQSTGIVEEVPEKLMDCVTAVSGSGPAFVFMFIEALADAAVRCGMPRKQAYIYAAQTVKGSASLVLETNKHPAELKDSVCSPAGTTIEGVAALEENDFRNSIIQAVTAAFNKSVQLGK